MGMDGSLFRLVAVVCDGTSCLVSCRLEVLLHFCEIPCSVPGFLYCMYRSSYDDGDERTHPLVAGKFFPFSGPNLPHEKGSGTKKKPHKRQGEATHNMPKLPDVATVQQWQVACVTKPVRRDDGAGVAASMDNGAQPHTLVRWPARLPHYPAGQLLLGGCVCVCVRE